MFRIDLTGVRKREKSSPGASKKPDDPAGDGKFQTDSTACNPLAADATALNLQIGILAL